METFTYKTRFWTLLALLVGAGLFGRPALAQTNTAQTTNVIYDDARAATWYPFTWPCGGGTIAVDFDQTEVVAGGQKALEVDFSSCTGGWGAFGFDHRNDWWQRYHVTADAGDVLTFKFNPGAETDDDAGIKISLQAGGTDQLLSRYLPSPMQPDTWYTVTIPLLDLVAPSVQFTALNLINASGENPHYYLDDLKFVEGGSPAQVPPVISGVAVTHVGPDSARVVWATDKPSKYTFRYTAGGQTTVEVFEGFATTGAFVARGLASATAYTFEVEALGEGADPSLPGAASTYAGSFTTLARDTEPPVVSNLSVAVFPNHATLTWETNEPATSRIEYGQGGLGQSVSDGVLKTVHRLSIPHLAPGTTYTFRVGGTDEQDNTGWNAADELTTLDGPLAGHVEAIYDDALATNWVDNRWACGSGQPAYDLAQSGTVASGAYAIEVQHTCGWGAFGLDHRKPDWTEKFFMYPNPGDVLVFRFNAGAVVEDDTSLTLTMGLDPDEGVEGRDQHLSKYLPTPVQPNTWYTVTIPLLDLMAAPTKFFRLYFFNTSAAQPHYFLDDVALAWRPVETPPAFTNVEVTHVGPDSARVAWATDLQSRYTFRFWKNGVPVEETFADYAGTGSRVLRDLAPQTTYAFEIEAVPLRAADPATTTARYAGTFTTAPPDQTPPVVSDLQVEVHSTYAVLTWTTDEPSTSQIEYGEGGLGQSVAATGRTTTHRLAVAGLSPTTTYQYRAGSTDRYGNTGWSATTTFTTTDALPAALTVDAGVSVRPFRDEMRGQGLANWAVYFNRPYPNDSPKLMELTRLIRPGFVRYAGGLWSNNMMWSRENIQRYPSRTVNGVFGMRSEFRDNPVDGVDRCGASPVVKPDAYSFVMQAEEMDRLAAFARYVDADVMVEVDVTTCDPEMWADMLRYVRVDKGYDFFKYWEIGNELDLERKAGYTDIPIGADYVARFKRYHDVLKAVDPSVVISGPTTASHNLDDLDFRPYPDFIDPLTADPDVRAQDMLGAFTFHYYPYWKNLRWGASPTYLDVMRYTDSVHVHRGRDYVPTMLGGMRDVLDSRGFHDTPISITEFNAVAADDYTPIVHNHTNALYMADMLGRLAYHGADQIAHWLLFDLSSESSYGLTTHNRSSIVAEYDGRIVLDDRYEPNPVYYAYLMYGQLFGDELVQTASSVEDRLSVWASTDTDEPGALKLIVTNTSDEAFEATVALAGVTIEHARAFELANPAWTAATNKDGVAGGTTINGLSIDAASAQSILASARAIMASGRPVQADSAGASFTYTFQPYTAVAILINAADVVLADIPALEPPVMLDPVAGDAPALRWQAASRAHTYTVQVSADPAFASLLVDAPNVTEAGFEVEGLAPGVTYYARVRSAVLGETSAWSEPQAFTTAGLSASAGVAAAGLNEMAEAPVQGEAELAPAYPNPFNPTTTFSVRLAQPQHLKVEVFDAIGRRVALLYDGQAEATSPLTFTFDAGHMASGLYLYRVTGETFARTGRMMLLK